MSEYAIFIVMANLTLGFAWVWFIEQRKKKRRKTFDPEKEIERG